MGSDPSFAGEGSLSRGPLLAGPMLGEVGETFARVWFQARDTSPLTLTLHAPAGDLAYELTPSEEDWLCERLKASTAPVKLLVSGSQMLPEAAATLGWECWRRDAPGELERLVSFLSQHDIRGVVLASGDVHLGYLLHEQGRSLPGGRVGPQL